MSTSSSSICTHFSQNAWKKDLCSNCFKSKDEHKQAKTNAGNESMVNKKLRTIGVIPTTDHSNHPVKMVAAAPSSSSSSPSCSHDGAPGLSNRAARHQQQQPVKSIIKKNSNSGNIRNSSVANGGGKVRPNPKVSFPKNVSEVIGFGGEWNDSDDEHDFMNFDNDTEDEKLLLSEDEESAELSRITRANTDFNMKTENLLGDADDNLRKSFAVLKLGAPQVDKEGKKQTLQINVTPFGSANGPIATTPTTSTTKTNNNKPSKEAKMLESSSTSVMGNEKSSKKVEEASSSVMNLKSSINLSTGQNANSKSDLTMSMSPRLQGTDGAESPPLERAMEKSLLDEISETLEKKQQQEKLCTNNQTNRDTNSGNMNGVGAGASGNKTVNGNAGLSKIKFEITSLTETLEQKTFLDVLKKPIVRNTPITRDQVKPKVNVFHKYSDTDSICSDNDNGISAYYDVVDTTITPTKSTANTADEDTLSYENVPHGKYDKKKHLNALDNDGEASKVKEESSSSNHGSITTTRHNIGNTSSIAANGSGVDSGRQQMNLNSPHQTANTIYTTSQYIADMLLSSKTRAASYNLHEGNVLTSQITSDGLVVTKCSSSDDALDSTSSSFDGSSDEETHYNMIRSESDSGIGISLGNDYKNLPQVEQERRPDLPKLTSKLSVSTNNSDYEDIQVNEQKSALTATNTAVTAKASLSSSVAGTVTSSSVNNEKAKANIIDKSRELHGEPDGSADPDGRLEACNTLEKAEKSMKLPALPKTPPPTKVAPTILDSRPSFLHGKIKQQQHFNIIGKKPDVPAKPVIISGGSGVGSNVSASIKNFLTKKSHQDNTERGNNFGKGGALSNGGNTITNSDSINLEPLKDEIMKLKKGKAPNPPLTASQLSIAAEIKALSISNNRHNTMDNDYSDHNHSANENHEDEGEEEYVNLAKSGENKGKDCNGIEEAAELKSQNDVESPNIKKFSMEQYHQQQQLMKNILRKKQIAEGAASLLNSEGGNMLSGCGTMSKAMAGQVLREKEKRERGIINPKFRSLNTFVMQRSNVLRNLHLQNAIPANQTKFSNNAASSASSPASASGAAAATSAVKTITPGRMLTDINLKASSNSGLKNQLSMSEECLTESGNNCAVASSLSTNNLVGIGNDKNGKSSGKTKSKFSIMKFLRKGSGGSNSGNIAGSTTKNSDNFLSRKKDNNHIYSEICTGEEANVVGKPRLVIIHPIDINPTALEVVKGDLVTPNGNTTASVTKGNRIIAGNVVGKPPAPPMRSIDGQRAHEINKPARPPPPKSAELRRKQSVDTSFDTFLGTAESLKSQSTVGTLTLSMGSVGRTMDDPINGSIKSKSDNVYANLGEIRSSMAPRKPERTASMREREAQLEIARKRIGGDRSSEAGDTFSICSSNGDKVTTGQSMSFSTSQQQPQNHNHLQASASPSNDLFHSNNAPSSGTFERSPKYEARPTISNKLEIFDATANNGAQQQRNGACLNENRSNILKDSVRKISHTIDSYLKDKQLHENNLYDIMKESANNSGNMKLPPPAPPSRGVDLQISTGTASITSVNNQPSVGRPRRNPLFSSDSMSIASYTRSEYLPANSRNYGFHNSIANLPRMVSASYCGSELGDMEVYAPYSYYGSEAGNDLGHDTLNDSVWGLNSTAGNKNGRTKTVNRLRMRKGRSVVHKTIEDNYSAVVGANHEALAQVLEQLQQSPAIPPALRSLGNAINLRFEDFAVLEGVQAFVVGKKAFHAAIWNTTPVTLALSADCQQLAGVGGELNQLSGGVSGALNPITEFCDLVPSYHLPLMPSTEVTLLQATISVLPRLQLDSLQSIGIILRSKSQALDKNTASSSNNLRGSIPNLNVLKEINSNSNSNCLMALRNGLSVQNLSTLHEQQLQQKQQQQQQQSIHSASLKDDNCQNNDDVSTNGNQQRMMNVSNSSGGNGISAFDDIMTREVAFIMLQLINGMKNLQVKGVEEMPLSLSNVVLAKEVDNKEAQARLCVLQGNQYDEDEAAMGTLCKCAFVALTEMLPSTKITAILRDILVQERSESLSKSKSVLEFVLWGPSDVVLSGSTKEREMALQRWLDLERATVLHGLVRTRIELTVYDECHLMFLVRSTAKIMNDAAKIINNYQQ